MLVIQAMNPIKITPHAESMVVQTSFEAVPLRRFSTYSPEGNRICFTRSLLCPHPATTSRPCYCDRTNRHRRLVPNRRESASAEEQGDLESAEGRVAEPVAGTSDSEPVAGAATPASAAGTPPPAPRAFGQARVASSAQQCTPQSSRWRPPLSPGRRQR